MVEFALAFPVLLLLLAVAVGAWQSVKLTEELTGAARAGAIVAASDIRGSSTAATASNDAVAAVNAELGAPPGTYTLGPATCPNRCVVVTPVAGATAFPVTTYQSVTVAARVSPFIPLVNLVVVQVHAAAASSP